VDRCDTYRHSAAKCVELARTMHSARDRLIMLEMALVWSRLAEFTVKIAPLSESARPYQASVAERPLALPPG
jgi:hypothetical protein